MKHYYLVTAQSKIDGKILTRVVHMRKKELLRALLYNLTEFGMRKNNIFVEYKTLLSITRVSKKYAEV